MAIAALAIAPGIIGSMLVAVMRWGKSDRRVVQETTHCCSRRAVSMTVRQRSPGGERASTGKERCRSRQQWKD